MRPQRCVCRAGWQQLALYQHHLVDRHRPDCEGAFQRAGRLQGRPTSRSPDFRHSGHREVRGATDWVPREARGRARVFDCGGQGHQSRAPAVAAHDWPVRLPIRWAGSIRARKRRCGRGESTGPCCAARGWWPLPTVQPLLNVAEELEREMDDVCATQVTPSASVPVQAKLVPEVFFGRAKGLARGLICQRREEGPHGATTGRRLHARPR